MSLKTKLTVLRLFIRCDSGAICGLLLRNARITVSQHRLLSAIIIVHLIYCYIVYNVIRKIVYIPMASSSTA